MKLLLTIATKLAATNWSETKIKCDRILTGKVFETHPNFSEIQYANSTTSCNL